MENFKFYYDNNKNNNINRPCMDSNNIKAPDLEVLPVRLSSCCLLISLLNRENSGSTVTLEGPVNTD